MFGEIFTQRVEATHTTPTHIKFTPELIIFLYVLQTDF